MISRRRMVFQLTALLDLLLVVLFAQYLETQEASNRAIGLEAARRAQEKTLRLQAESDRSETDKLRHAATTRMSDLTDQIERLSAERDLLRNDLAVARQQVGTAQARSEEEQKQAAEQTAAIGKLFQQRLNIAPEALGAYLSAASPGERQRLLDAMQQLREGSTSSVIHHLRTTLEFRKLSSLWEIHIFDDNAVRIRIDDEDVVPRFHPTSASHFANRLIEAAKEKGEPRSLVVVLLTWSDADRRTRDLVTRGAQDAIANLRSAWGATKRIELSRLGYTPQAP
jgi:hypothetical protein